MSFRSPMNYQSAPPSTSIWTNLLQRKCACGGNSGASGECQECRKKREGVLQRSALPGRSTPSVPPIVHQALNSPGQPLDSATRSFMEPQFGHDFSRVRIHTDATAARSAQAVGAQAYTVGPNIVFGARQYAPTTGAGQRLLAHELTHVVQQGSSAGVLQPAGVGPVNDHLEAEADRVARQVATDNPVTVIGQTSSKVQRNPGWSSDALTIRLTPLDPKTPPQDFYLVNGYLNQRMSMKLPRYRGPFCQNVTLPFKCDVEFLVDDSGDPRPAPFAAPHVSVEFEFVVPQAGGSSLSKFKVSHSDNNPAYGGQDRALVTNFGTHFNLSLDDNGEFKMKFKLDDPDSGVSLVYDDTIGVEANRPCM